MYRYNFEGRREARKASAKERQEKYSKMTTKQKLDLQMAGGHYGRQYDRLLKQLEKETKGE